MRSYIEFSLAVLGCCRSKPLKRHLLRSRVAEWWRTGGVPFQGRSWRQSVGGCWWTCLSRAVLPSTPSFKTTPRCSRIQTKPTTPMYRGSHTTKTSPAQTTAPSKTLWCPSTRASPTSMGLTEDCNEGCCACCAELHGFIEFSQGLGPEHGWGLSRRQIKETPKPLKPKP